MFNRFLIEDEYNRTEKQTKFDLSSATPDALSLKEVLELFPVNKKDQILAEILNCKLAYSEQFGLATLRAKLAATIYASSKLSADNFLISTGASEAILLVFSTLFSSGDTIIIQKPIYQSLYQIALDNGIEVIDWDYDLQTDFVENFAQLTKLLKTNPACKALVINNPNNPLGIGFATEELKQISELLEDRLLIADEVARGISLKPLPSAIEIHPNSIVISDLSKSYSLPGLRLGWIVSSNSGLLEKFSAQKNYLSLRSPALSELIAKYVLEVIDLVATKNKNIIQKNLDYVFAQKYKIQSFFTCDFAPEIICGHTIFPRLTCDVSYLDRWFAEQGIFIARGKFFGEKYSQHIRIGLAKSSLINSLLLTQQEQSISA